MFYFILLIIFLVLVLPPILKGYAYYKRLKKVFTYAGKSNNESKKIKKKIFNKDEGEYIAFEEISYDDIEYSDTIKNNKDETVMTENQIVDIDWEEV